MLHTTSKGNGPSDFKEFLVYMGMSAILVMRPEQFVWLTCRKESFYMKIQSNWPNGF